MESHEIGICGQHGKFPCEHHLLKYTQSLKDCCRFLLTTAYPGERRPFNTLHSLSTQDSPLCPRCCSLFALFFKNNSDRISTFATVAFEGFIDTFYIWNSAKRDARFIWQQFVQILGLYIGRYLALFKFYSRRCRSHQAWCR
jgi:hypothetical protein